MDEDLAATASDVRFEIEDSLRELHADLPRPSREEAVDRIAERSIWRRYVIAGRDAREMIWTVLADVEEHEDWDEDWEGDFGDESGQESDNEVTQEADQSSAGQPTPSMQLPPAEDVARFLAALVDRDGPGRDAAGGAASS